LTKAIICGGRDFLNLEYALSELDRVHRERKITCVIEGGARGADYLARLWAKDRGIKVITYPAKWKELKKGAGPIRNQEMLDAEKPALVIAMPGGSGTAHMKRIAEQHGVEVLEICL